MTGGVHFQMIKSVQRDYICTLLYVLAGMYFKLHYEAEVGDSGAPLSSDKTLKSFLRGPENEISARRQGDKYSAALISDSVKSCFGEE